MTQQLPSTTTTAGVHHDESSWRVRDAAEVLLRQKGLVSTSLGNDANHPMALSKYFDVETCQARLLRDKAPTVRTALDAAASAILENLHKVDDDDDDDDSEEEDPMSSTQLPAILEDIVTLQSMRVASMERAHANKDLAKRRIAVAKEQEQMREQQQGTKPSLASVVAASLQKETDQKTKPPAASSSKPATNIKKEDKTAPIKKEDKTDIVSPPASTTTTAKEDPVPSPVKVKKEDDSSVKPDTVASKTTTNASSTEEAKPVATVKQEDGSDTNASSSAAAGTSTTPKFTRNTPASSASALEARLNASRAILCATANKTFDALTPSLPEWETIEVGDVPQNIDQNGTNMESVVQESKILGQRIENVATNAARRSRKRFRFRKDNVLFGSSNSSNNYKGFRILENPFAWKDDEDDGSCSMQVDETASIVTADTNDDHHRTGGHTEAWTKVCVPRLLSILQTGVGNAILHDTQWFTRHGRIANLLQEIAVSSRNEDETDQERTETSNKTYGPHLIVTVGPEIDRFAKEFKAANSHLRLLTTVDEGSLRALPYRGTKEERTNLRKRFPEATGLPDSSFHVVITSYADFLRDYIHFCQTPFEVVLFDDGASWMAAAHNDPNSPIGTVWNEAIFSKNDHQMGLAGASTKDWDYTKDKIDDETMKEAWIGLTCQHRLVTSSTQRVETSKSPTDLLPVSGLLNYVLPHFADAVREEWDRSRIANDTPSMGHFRKLLARSLVVHDPGSINVEEPSLFELAMKTLKGELEESVRSLNGPPVPEVIPDERFVADGKVASSRRYALQWLGPSEDSWLRYELGSVSFEPILAATRASLNHGHICEEIATASSISTGATGQIIGNLAFKLAIRCGKCFGSEQGLRQHLSTHHAPPGTWLCRTCKADCVTSQARTHHERSCGQASNTSTNPSKNDASTSTATTKKDTGKKKGGKSKSKDEKNAVVPSASGLGGGVVPALSVINIKGLPPDVKPLLRDPRQTSRTGGNSKRHVYAYRGVCRQARKGHDRWQSQISFLGVNHYLGTFDSEWDAAAIYAWAHLILYGEEATRQAQKEGEEAAAAYEQEKKDIAAGIIPAAPAKPDKKGKQPAKKKVGEEKATGKKKKKEITKPDEKPSAGLKRKPGRPKKPSEQPTKRLKTSAAGKEDITHILAKSVGKSTILAPMPKFVEMSDDQLAKEAAVRMVAARSVNYCITEVALAAPIHIDFRPAIPRGTAGSSEQMGGALLMGLDPSLFGWSIETILSNQYFGSEGERKNATTILTDEFGADGLNQQFRSLLQGSTTVIGCASSRTKRVYASMGMGTPPLGGSIGRIDCNTGGNSKCCSETAACIRYVPTEFGDFQLSALSNDLITINGQRITPEMGTFPLFNEDICTIGSRVFLFLLPSDS